MPGDAKVLLINFDYEKEGLTFFVTLRKDLCSYCFGKGTSLCALRPIGCLKICSLGTVGSTVVNFGDSLVR